MLKESVSIFTLRKCKAFDHSKYTQSKIINNLITVVHVYKECLSPDSLVYRIYNLGRGPADRYRSSKRLNLFPDSSAAKWT